VGGDIQNHKRKNDNDEERILDSSSKQYAGKEKLFTGKKSQKYKIRESHVYSKGWGLIGEKIVEKKK